MTTDKHAPDSLKYQWRLLGTVLRSDWATGLDKSISYEIIDNYMKDRGNARASLTYLEKATGADRKSVIASTRRIVKNGPFAVARPGKGTRPTEYDIDFDLVAEKPSSGVDATTNIDLPSSGVQPTTGSGVEPTTSGPSSGVDATQTVLRTRLTAGVQEDGNMNTPAPLADGLAATAGARDPESAFDRFWQSYPRKYQKQKARAAWDKLAPSPELAERIILEAGRWAEHYREHPVDKKWIPAPANWLAGERYDEDLPEVYVDAKEAAIAKKRDKARNRAEPKTEKTDPEADNDDEPVEWIGEVSAFMTPGRYEFKIAGVRLITEPGKYHDNQSVELMLDSIQSPGFWMPRGVPHRLHVQHDDETVQARDVARLERLGVEEDIDGLIGRTFFATVTRAGYVEYERAAA